MRTMIVLGLLLLGALAYVKQHPEYHQYFTSKALFEVQFNKADSKTDEYTPNRQNTHYYDTNK